MSCQRAPWVVAACATALACCCRLSFAAKPLLVVQDETLGVNIVPPEESTWQSKTVRMHRPHTAADLRARPGEFFELEYGRPLDITGLAILNGIELFRITSSSVAGTLDERKTGML